MEPPKHAQERQLPPHFSRELGRAITFLIRGRTRFMYLILLHLEHHPGATQDSIANHLFIDKCNVARRTKKLETLGYLYRETNQNDRRENHLYLTDKGRELVPTIREYLGQWGRSITADLTDTECAELLALLTKMTGQDRK